MFQNLCKEDRELYLKDGTEKIWEGRRIDEAVRRARKNEEWRSEYMKELLHDDDVREEGRAEGESQLVKLINSMIAGGDGDKIALFGEPEILKTMKQKYGIN